MEHSWGIKCGKMKTPMEIWNDEEHLKKGLNKILSGTFFKKKPRSFNYRIRYEIYVKKIHRHTNGF